MSRVVRALQPLSISTWHDQQQLDEGTVEPGETFTLLSGNGYRTEVEPPGYLEDRRILRSARYGSEEYEAASARMNAWHFYRFGEIETSPYGIPYEEAK